jgi:PKD repeat protein
MKLHVIVFTIIIIFLAIAGLVIPVNGASLTPINNVSPFDSPYGMITVNATVAGYSITQLPVYYGVLRQEELINKRFQDSRPRQNVTTPEEAPEIAQNVLEPYGGLPDDAISQGAFTQYEKVYNFTLGQYVSENTESTTITYSQKPINGLWTIGDSNRIIVELGENGEVLRVVKKWRNYTYLNDVPVIPLNTAFEKLRRGEVISGPMVVDEDTTIDIASLGYYAKIVGTSDAVLEPIWMLYGNTSSGSRIGFYIYARQFANFTVYPSTEVTRYEPVYFMDQSETNVTRWSWDFGDGTNSTEQNPWHLYKTGGNYTVNLTVWNDMGSDTISRQDYIHVYYTSPAPVAQFTTNYSSGYNCGADPLVNVSPVTIQFTDESLVFGNDTQWFWDFGDGTNSTEQNPVHTLIYQEPDNCEYYNCFSTGYWINLTVIDNYGRTSSFTDWYVIYRDIQLDFEGEPTSGVSPLSVNFTELPDEYPERMVRNRTWDFGDGSSFMWYPEWDQNGNLLSPLKNIMHVYTSPGNYTVTFSKEDDDCAGMYRKTKEYYVVVSEYSKQIVPDFSANETFGRTPFAVGFTDISGGSPTAWNWSLGDGAYSTDQNPVHTYTTAGTYTVSLTASNAYEENTTTKIDYISVFEHLPPAADFTANVTSGYEPLAVAFSDSSANGPEQWNWSFGDGTFSTEHNPVHLYLKPGVYSVSLEVTNGYGTDSIIRANYITVIGAFLTQTITVPPPLPPETNFTGTPVSGKEPLTVIFNDTSANYPDSWFWDFGDGTNATEEDPIHTYTAAGDYTVSLNATNEAGTNTTIKTDYITVLPLSLPFAEFNANTTSGTVPLAVEFTDISAGSPTGWSWTFGDGGISQEQNPVHVYTITGQFTVTLQVTNEDGSNSTTKEQFITGSTLVLPVAEFAANTTSGIAPLAVGFTDQSTGSPVTWHWTFGDGATSDEQNPEHTYTDTGSYTVSLEVTNPDGSNTTTKTDYITVTSDIQPPVASFTGKPTYGKAPLTVKFNDTSTRSPTSWSWDFGDGTIATEQNPVHIYTTAGKYTVSLTAMNAGGSNTRTRNEYITVKATPPPTANFYGKPTYGKAPLAVKFTDSSTGSPTGWYWEFGDGTTGTAQHPVHSYTAAGKYTVSLTASNAAGNTTKTRTEYITVKSTTPTPTCTPSQCEPHELPQVTGNITQDNKVRLDWNVITNPCLQGYKVVISKNNPYPKYPDDGYMFWITNRNTNYSVISSTDHYNGGDFGGYLQPGQSYYFSITAVYSDTKVAGNVVLLQYPG